VAEAEGLPVAASTQGELARRAYEETAIAESDKDAGQLLVWFV
jgi:hypothetical protein